MERNFDAVYYEPEALGYELGRELKEKFRACRGTRSSLITASENFPPPRTVNFPCSNAT